MRIEIRLMALGLFLIVLIAAACQQQVLARDLAGANLEHERGLLRP